MVKNPKPYIAFSIIPLYFLVKLLSFFPEFVENFYSNGLYPILSKSMRYILGWLPFSFGDLVYGISVIMILRWLYKNARRLTRDTKQWLVDVFAAVSVVYFAFHILWGMNYYRLPLHENLGLESEYTTEELIDVTRSLIAASNHAHLKLVPHDSIQVEIPYSKSEIINLVPEGYDRLEMDYPELQYRTKSIKRSIFSLPLTYMGFAGYLNPLTNEAHVDGLIPSFKYPTTASHEVAHQLGYAAENEANFIGFLASIHHQDSYFNYSGFTFGLRHCLIEIYKRDEEVYHELLDTLNPGIIKNYQEVQEFWDSYKNPAEIIFRYTYDGFLKANQQTGGMQSSSYVVALIVNFYTK